MAKNQGFTIPKDFFTPATFLTCGGCASVVWVVTGVLSSLFQSLFQINAERIVGLIGLIVAIGVAYLGLFLSKPKRKIQYVITFLNGFLIYATVVGAASFTPLINKQTANVVQQTKLDLRGILTRPWIYDRNLVSATRNLISIQQEQSSTLDKLDKTITTIESGLMREDRLSAESKTTMLNQLSEGKKAIQSTKDEIKPRTTSLERFGLSRLPVRRDLPR